ncbi:MAG TPA: PqqD family peptide modification chaperone [Actinomycetota bacterium]
MAVEELTDVLEETADGEEMSAEDIDGSFVPRIRPEVNGVEVDGEAVLVIEGPWSIHWLNQISTVVFDELDGVSTVDDVADRLSRAFQADPEVVRNDVLDLTRQLGRGGFLEGVAIEEIQYTSPSNEGLPVGTAVPPFELSDLTGQTVTHEDLQGRQTLLVNWSPHCSFCGRIGPEIAELQPKLRARGVKTVFISIGSADEVKEQLGEFGLDVPVFLQETDRAEIFDGMGTPVAYLIDAEGKTASELAYGSDQVPTLIRAAAGISETNGADKKKPRRSKKTSGSKKAGGSRKRVSAKG